MKIAVEGCCHGELDKIYETLAYLEQQNNIKVDLLLICGDFQAVRNTSDLQAMAVPQKYQKLNTFWKYYSGEKTAPVLTLFIGGNHEASNYLQELPYGGWVAPNIYYMGYASVVQFGGVRIAGLSGIYKGRDYGKGHYEHPPYSEDTKRSCYHIRNLEVFRLKQKPIDIILSHDWPRGIYDYGNVKGLLQRKKFFREEVESGTLGSPPAEELLFKLKPDYWFSAHLHVKFAAVVDHKTEPGESKQTKFLSLDKCLPRRKFLQVFDFPTDPDKPLELELDAEWLSVLKSTNHLLNLYKSQTFMPGEGYTERWNFSPTEAELKAVSEDFGALFAVPQNFEKTAPVHDPKHNGKNSAPQIHINPQTTLLCEMLGITDPYAVFSGRQQHSTEQPSSVSSAGNDSAYLEDSSVNDSDFIETTFETSSLGNSTFETTHNPDEISLDDLDDDLEDKDEQDDENVPEEKNIPVLNLSAVLPVKAIDLSNDECLSPENGCQAMSSPTNPSPSRQDEACPEDSINASMDSSSSSSPSVKRGVDGDCAVSDSSTQSTNSKKFKRRNQSIYTSDSDL